MGSTPGSGRSLEKETATHSSILAWRIPWTEEPGRLRSMGLQRVNSVAKIQLNEFTLTSLFFGDLSLRERWAERGWI